jgi:hypothetical protein
MPSKISNPVVYKIIFRADFPVTLDYVASFGSVAAKLKGYPTWEVEAGKVMLHDPEKCRSATLDAGAIIYEQDSGDENSALQSIDDILRTWPQLLNISEYRRLGFRKKYLISGKFAFDQLVALVNSRAFRLEDLTTFLPKIEDSYMRFDCIEEPYRFHIGLGPVRRREILSAMEFNRNHLNPNTARKDLQKINDDYPETAAFLDLDFFQMDGKMKAESVNSFLIAGRKRLDQISEKWAEFLLNEN